MQTESINKEFSTIDAAKQWFDGMVVNLSLDEQLHKNDILDNNKKEFYDNMISGDQIKIHDYALNAASQYFIGNLLNDYIQELAGRFKKLPKKLGLELSHGKILVWAEIINNDDETENALILAQAKVNSKYEKHGFHISSTIVEEIDNLELPKHYTQVVLPIK